MTETWIAVVHAFIIFVVVAPLVLPRNHTT